MTLEDLEDQAPTVQLALRLGYRIIRHRPQAYTVTLCGRSLLAGLVLDDYESALGVIISEIESAPKA